MRNLPMAFQNHMQGQLLTVCTLIDIVRRDAVEMYYSSHDETLIIGGKIYKPANGFNPTAIQQMVGTGVDNMDIVGLLTDDAITPEDLHLGKYDGATVTLSIVNYDALTDGQVTLLAGWIGEIIIKDGSFVVDLRGQSQKLTQQVGALTSPMCRVRVFGDAECSPPLPIASYQETLEVTALAQSGGAVAEVGIIDINCGTATTVGSFVGDTYYTDGDFSDFYAHTISTSLVTNPAPLNVYKTHHTSLYSSTFSYNIPGLTVGQQYRVRLHFCETVWGPGGTKDTSESAAGKRLFNIYANDRRIATGFDVWARTGATNAAWIEDVDLYPKSNGVLTLMFEDIKDNAMVSGIEVFIPEYDGVSGAIRLDGSARETGYYEYGTAEFLDGENGGLIFKIAEHARDSGDALIKLFQSTPFPIVTGTTIKLTAGCDRLLPTCIYRFNNRYNFRGEPLSPGNDAIIKVGRGGI